MSPEKRLAEEEANGQEPKRLKEDTSVTEENIDGLEKSNIPEVAEETDKDTKEENAASEAAASTDSEEKKPISEKCGMLVLAGCVQWNLIGRRNQKAMPTMQHFTPRRIKAFANIKVAGVASHSSAAHAVVITQFGKVWTLGRNDKGQLGVGDCEEHAGPKEVVGLDDVVIVVAACGRNHTLLLSDAGEVYAFGENKSGQCGLGNTNAQILTPQKMDFKEGKVTKISCGAEFSMIVDSRGSLYSFGCPEYGQLGHNTDGKYFVTSNRLSYHFETSPRRIPVFVECSKGGHPSPVPDVQIVNVACGNNHAVAWDTKKRAYAWGFGGYGRLGHAEPKDEMVPRLIKFFDGPNRGVSQVYCGGSFSIANTDLGIYLWGQTKRTGEANMYPKPIQDLYGWNVRSVGCSATSIVIAADDSVIAWGPSPTYGELGLGDNTKSTTTPKECKLLDGAHVYHVTCGYGLTLYVVRNDTEDDKSLLAKLKEITV